MDIYIHKDVLGFQQHLVVSNGKINKVKTIPDSSPLVYGTPELLEIAKLYRVTLPSFPPEPHVKALQSVLGDRNVSEVPWSAALPARGFKRAVEALAQDLTNAFSGIDLTYYQTHYQSTMPLLRQMKRAKIDPRAWMVHTSNPDLVTPHVLQTFEPDEDGFAQETVYSKCDTKTGRLKVLRGPQILHLPKEQRNVLGSRWGREGKIVSLDFSALEPRIVLFINQLLSDPLSGNPPFLSQNTTEQDIYRNVLTSLEIRDISRDAVKEVVLSQLYGAGYESIMDKLSGIKDPNGFIEAVSDFFGLNKIRARLLQEYESNNREFIMSFYGRPVDTREAKPYMLLNYYIQPTGVDVALYGFKNVVRAIDRNPFVIPLFILHDALILDVHNKFEDSLRNLALVGGRDIPMFPGCEFTIKVSRF